MKRNRRNMFIVICFSLIVFLLLSSYDSGKDINIRQQLLEEMKHTNVKVDEILHLEVINDGILVFYERDNLLYDAFIKLKGDNWEWYFGGGALPLQTDDLGFAFSNYDQFFIRYGTTTDNGIQRVKVKDKDDYAKSIQLEDGTNIFLFINKSVEFDTKNNQTRYEEIIPVYYSAN